MGVLCVREASSNYLKVTFSSYLIPPPVQIFLEHTSLVGSQVCQVNFHHAFFLFEYVPISVAKANIV